MLNFKTFLKKFIYWTVPAGIYENCKTNFNWNALSYYYFNGLDLFKKNQEYKNKHNGKRCFIVCNGPSVVEQDLTLLKNEIVFTVSNGYMHKNFDILSPKYHCVPGLTYTEKFNEYDAVGWFQDMDRNLSRSEIFLNYTEEILVRKHNLFKERKVNYIFCGRKFKRNEHKIVDLTKIIPGVASVPVMCLVIAMYMGFKKIYLLGVEHNEYVNREYKYAFEQYFTKGKISILNEKNLLLVTQLESLETKVILWKQYLNILSIAQKNNIEIYNTTIGGSLDVFPRISYLKALEN